MDLRQSIARIRKDYMLLIYGFILGCITITSIFQEAVNIMLFLQIVTIVLLGMLYIKKVPKMPSNPTTKSETVKTPALPRIVKVCPECGSPTKHKRGCSKPEKVDVKNVVASK